MIKIEIKNCLELYRFAWNETELLTYDQAEKYAGAQRASLAYQFDQGMEKGRLEERFEIARQLLQKNYSIHMVEEVTGLSSDQIKNL